MSPPTRDYAHFFWDLVTGARFQAEIEVARWREDRFTRFLDTSKPLQILDLAGGRLQLQDQILRSQGHHVIGLDIANREQGDWTDRAYRFARWM